MSRFINLPNLLTLLVLGAGTISFFHTTFQQKTFLEEVVVSSSKDLLSNEAKQERVELIIFNPNLQRSTRSFIRYIEAVNLLLPQSDNRRLETILASLRDVMSEKQACQNLEMEKCRIKKTIWPIELLAPQVFVTNFISGQSIVIVNFALNATVKVSVKQEKALLNSIKETLNRNGFISNAQQLTNVYILINGEVPKTFLGHVALVPMLE